MENYEKKYKEALETARKINSGEGVAGPKDWSILEVIFPELRKSKDELIKEELIHFLETCQDPRFVGNRKQDEWISWLEKQGEQKQVSITDEWIEDYWQHEKVNNPNSYDKGDEIQFDHDGFIRFYKDIANRQKEQTVNKASKWLAGNVIRYIWKSNKGGIGISDNFFIDFEKAMEEQ